MNVSSRPVVCFSICSVVNKTLVTACLVLGIRKATNPGFASIAVVSRGSTARHSIKTHTHTHLDGLRQFLAMIISTGRRDISVWGFDRQFGERSSRRAEMFPFAT